MSIPAKFRRKRGKYVLGYKFTDGYREISANAWDYIAEVIYRFNPNKTLLIVYCDEGYGPHRVRREFVNKFIRRMWNKGYITFDSNGNFILTELGLKNRNKYFNILKRND